MFSMFQSPERYKQNWPYGSASAFIPSISNKYDYVLGQRHRRCLCASRCAHGNTFSIVLGIRRRRALTTSMKLDSPSRARPFAAFLATCIVACSPAQSSALTEAQKLVAEAWRVVDQAYVDRTFNGHDWFSVRMKAIKRGYNTVDDGYSGIREMLSLLDDPYTRFLTPQQFTSLSSSATGELAGVGVEMFPARVSGSIRVTAPLDDSPAARAGIKPDDVIKFIDGEATDSLSPDEAAARIRGKPGTSISLTVVHDGGNGKEESVKMKRETLRLKSVKSSLLGNGHVGYFRVKQFNSSTADDMRKAVEELREKDDVKKFVIDLRNNPGGYFPAGVDVARLFLKSGQPIVYVMDKNGIQDEIDNVVDGLVVDKPLYVLVNKATASASEILAGALKDNDRAVIVGEQTFGKGVVQTVTQLRDGSGIAVTVARYETPAHKDINKVGIAPDVLKPCPIEKDVTACIPESK